MLFLPVNGELFEINLCQLTSGEVLLKNYNWEYVSLDIVPRTSAVRLVHNNLQPRMQSAHRLTLRSYNQPSN